MLIRSQTANLFQIFCELLLYSQVIFKRMKVADDTFLGNSYVNGLNRILFYCFRKVEQILYLKSYVGKCQIVLTPDVKELPVINPCAASD